MIGMDLFGEEDTLDSIGMLMENAQKGKGKRW